MSRLLPATMMGLVLLTACTENEIVEKQETEEADPGTTGPTEDGGDDGGTTDPGGDTGPADDTGTGDTAEPEPLDSDGDGSPDDEDCDDADPTVYPGAAEACNGRDDDCDELIDEEVQETWYADTDSDSYGDPAAPIEACAPPTGYVADHTDCDDGNGDIHPAATEVCNGYDDDCDVLIDDEDPSLDTRTRSDWYPDTDADAYGDPAGLVSACTAPSGYVTDATDCDDGADHIYPGATETCDGVDEDCDTVIDNGATCPCTTSTYGTHTYQFCTTAMEWTDASADCALSGYTLATIDDAAENTWVYDEAQLISAGEWWIGLNDLTTEGTFEWESGATVSYTSWGSSQPDNGGGTEHCTHYGYGGSYMWNDDQCYNPKAYVCESP